jgi:hypothetical protein
MLTLAVKMGKKQPKRNKDTLIHAVEAKRKEEEERCWLSYQ